MRTLAVVLSLCTGLLVAGCGVIGSDGIRFSEDVELTQQLEELRAPGGSRPLVDLVLGDWDTVHLFTEGSTWELVSETIGRPVDNRGPFFTYNALAFMRGDEVVRTALLIDQQFYSGGTFTRDAIIVARRPEILADLFEPDEVPQIVSN